MPAKRIVTERQWEVLLCFMEANPLLANGSLANEGPLGKQRAQVAWLDLTSQLNCVSQGCKKSVRQWRDYWSCVKYSAKKKVWSQQERTGSDGEPIPSPLVQWSDREERVVALLGAVPNYPESSASVSYDNGEIPTGPPLSHVSSRLSPSQPATPQLTLLPTASLLASCPTSVPDAALFPKVEMRDESPPSRSPSEQDQSDSRSARARSRRYRNRYVPDAPDWFLRLEEKRAVIDQQLANAASLQASYGQKLTQTLQELVRAMHAQTRELGAIRRTLEARSPLDDTASRDS